MRAGGACASQWRRKARRTPATQQTESGTETAAATAPEVGAGAGASAAEATLASTATATTTAKAITAEGTLAIALG